MHSPAAWPCQRLGFIAGLVVLGQSVDGKCLPVDALLGIEWIAEMIEHPVNTAELVIPEVAREVLVSAASSGQIQRIAIEADTLWRRSIVCAR